jgi:ABC-type multidrug transport system fused ATPase/permease subunit
MQMIRSQINKLRLLRENLLSATARLSSGRAVIKQFGREAYENERLKTALSEYAESCNAFALKAAFAAAFYVLAAFLSLTAVVIAAGIAVVDGNLTETAVVVITVLVFALFASFGIFTVIWLKNQFKPIDKNEATKAAPIAYGDITEATDRNDLNFAGISFSYGGREIFSGLSFYVKSGESFAVLGRTGAGKTTFERILARELTPDAGIITIGGINTADFTEELLHKRLKTLDFITSNRVSDVMNRDLIILLDGGVVSGCGTHQKLLVSSSVYRKMYEAEFGVNPYKSMDKGENFDDFL